MRSGARFPGVLAAALAASTAACAGTPRLPSPVEPLASTPDAPFRAAPPSDRPEPAFAFGPVTQARLDNGLEVWVQRRPGWPRVSIRFATRRASSVTTGDDGGLAFLVAQLVEDDRQGRGTDDRRRDALDGSPLSASVGPFGTVVGLEATSRELPDAVRKLARAVRAPEVDPETLGELRVAQLYGIRSEGYSPGTTALRLALEGLFGERHPLTRSSLGDAETVEELGPVDVVAYHRGHYVPQESILVAVGDAEPGELLLLANAHFGSWAPGPRRVARPLPALPPPRTEPSPVTVADIGAGGEPIILVAQRAPDLSAPDYAAFRVLIQILGGGASSRLAQRLREGSGYTYDASTTYMALPTTGVLVTRTAVAPSQVGLALRAIQEETARLRDGGVDDEELRAAKMTVRHAIQASAGRTPGGAALLVHAYLTGETPERVDVLETELRRVTSEDVVAAARAHLRPETARKVVAGFLRTYEGALEAAGYYDLDVFRRSEN